MSGQFEPAKLTGSLSPGALAKGVHDTLESAYAAIPDGHTHAIFLDANYSEADGPAGRVVFVQKAPQGWNVAMSAGYDKPHGASAGVDLLRSW